jgi:hypothetical protein
MSLIEAARYHQNMAERALILQKQSTLCSVAERGAIPVGTCTASQAHGRRSTAIAVYRKWQVLMAFGALDRNAMQEQYD